MMTILEDAAKICKSSDRCNYKCPLYDNDINVGTCLFNYDPCDWDIKRIREALRKEDKSDNNT